MTNTERDTCCGVDEDCRAPAGFSILNEFEQANLDAVEQAIAALRQSSRTETR